MIVYLGLQVVDLGPALRQFFVGRHKQTHHSQPDRDEEQDEQDPIQTLPNCSFAPRAEIAVALIH